MYNAAMCKASRIVLAAVAGAFLWTASIRAHHSFTSAYDANRPITLNGSVTKVEWINPHAKLYITVKNEQTGKEEDWELQMAAANQLRRNGFPLSARGCAKVGDPITATAFAARDGSTTGLLRSITFADGRTFTRGVYGEADLAK